MPLSCAVTSGELCISTAAIWKLKYTQDDSSLRSASFSWVGEHLSQLAHTNNQLWTEATFTNEWEETVFNFSEISYQLISDDVYGRFYSPRIKILFKCQQRPDIFIV